MFQVSFCYLITGAVRVSVHHHEVMIVRMLLFSQDALRHEGWAFNSFARDSIRFVSHAGLPGKICNI